MTFVITGGGIDLSVGAVVALSSVWCTTVATQELAATRTGRDGPGAALAVGAGCGLVNGLLVAYGKVVAFIATLAMLVAARGLAEIISDNRNQIVDVPGLHRLLHVQALGIDMLDLGLRRSWRWSAGCCSTAPPSVGAPSPSAATPRRPGWPASTCSATPCCSTCWSGCAAASPR